MATADHDACGRSAAENQVDDAYEFSAPMWFDFMNEESDDEIRKAELWFERSLSYAPSPCMPRIKERRTVKIDALCDFSGDDDPMAVDKTCDFKPGEGCETNAPEQEKESGVVIGDVVTSSDVPCTVEKPMPLELMTKQMQKDVAPSANGTDVPVVDVAPAATEFADPVCGDDTVRAVDSTPKSKMKTAKVAAVANSGKSLNAKKIANMLKQTASRTAKLNSVAKCSRDLTGRNNMTVDTAQENQAVKRQKLDGGRSKQIHNVKERLFPHKARANCPEISSHKISATTKQCQEELHKVKDGVSFISAAEMVRKFESTPRDLEISRDRSIVSRDIEAHNRPKLMLTRPKEPELQTAHRVRAVRVKSSAEIEEEMLAKIPKFKARPFNKKIAIPLAPSIPRSTPKQPEFREFHFATTGRATRHADTSSEASTVDISFQDDKKALKLTEPKPPQLETALRARPPKVKSSQELELEELEKAPRFKARPLNRKILDSKVDCGVFARLKPKLTTPKEFHFATVDRMGPPPATSVEDLSFDKISLYSESSCHDKPELPKLTTPNPFHLQTDERGLEKERQRAMQILQKQLEEENARIPKAKPYPYTTDYPVVPPKPEPKPCTRPEPFQLESLVRHEEEMQRKMEEKERMEIEEAQKRIFRAQPIIREDPAPLPPRERKPLTDVQEFVLHVDNRSLERLEFDRKVKEKEMSYKRLREESECAKQMEEERLMKQLRSTMVPHAKPLPKFDNPFMPRRSMKPTTKPKSPHLLVDQRNEKRAFHMR